jgi:hypothetical protein
MRLESERARQRLKKAGRGSDHLPAEAAHVWDKIQGLLNIPVLS